MSNQSYFLVNFGCQMNEHDAEVISGILESLGFTAAPQMADAGMVIINTCAVREKPERKVAALLGRLKKQKEDNPDLFIAVGGCMPQQREAAAYIQRRFPYVNLVFGTHSLPRFPLLLEQARRHRGPLVDIEEYPGSREGLPIRRANSFRAWVPVIYGCNNFCSYCVVPYVRGRERSRPPAKVLEEVRRLARDGYLEITLLGQNVNSYGNDLPEKYSFADLLAEVDAVEGLARVRFLTSHPKDLSPALIETVSAGKKICEHFHLPVQSGSDRILKLMNRRYTAEQYMELLQAIRENIPGVAITTDIIVGFPGEMEEDFRRTLELVEEARFDAAFTFLYSVRRGTAAEALADPVPRAEKEERLERLMSVQNRNSLRINRSLVGKTVEVLVEGPSKGNPAVFSGRTRTNKLVHFTADKDFTGRLLEIKIREGQTWYLLGEAAAVQQRKP